MIGNQSFTVVKRNNKKEKKMLFSPADEEEARVEIEEIREYQREIFENCKDKNSIIFLETGTGKTLISILLIDYYFKKFQKTKKVDTNTLIVE
jgi:superfamily II DNA or RNA helicase